MAYTYQNLPPQFNADVNLAIYEVTMDSDTDGRQWFIVAATSGRDAENQCQLYARLVSQKNPQVVEVRSLAGASFFAARGVLGYATHPVELAVRAYGWSPVTLPLIKS